MLWNIPEKFGITELCKNWSKVSLVFVLKKIIFCSSSDFFVFLLSKKYWRSVLFWIFNLWCFLLFYILENRNSKFKVSKISQNIFNILKNSFHHFSMFKMWSNPYNKQVWYESNICKFVCTQLLHKLYLFERCPPLNRITLGRHKSDNNNRMIQLTNVFLCTVEV